MLKKVIFCVEMTYSAICQNAEILQLYSSQEIFFFHLTYYAFLGIFVVLSHQVVKILRFNAIKTDFYDLP